MNKAIKKIELDLGGKIVSLTPEQAKNLKDALDDLFGKEIVRVKEYVPFPITYPNEPMPQPIQPYYWEWWRQPTYYYRDDTVTCMAGTGDEYVKDVYSTNGVSCTSLGTLKLTG